MKNIDEDTTLAELEEMLKERDVTHLRLRGYLGKSWHQTGGGSLAEAFDKLLKRIDSTVER